MNPIRERFLERDTAEQEHNTKMAKGLLGHAQKVVVFTGAGISAESGIATFRDPDTGAMWGKFDPEIFSSMRGFEENPELVWDWYDALFKKMTAVSPNRGHELIAELEKKHEVTVVTQNIDNLHERAGSTNVVHLHGPGGVRCTACEWKGTREQTTDSSPPTVPFCPECGSCARPDVVWFGEMLPAEPWEKAMTAMREAYVCIVVGTSGQVEPAASMPSLARQVISINTRAEDHARLAFNAITLTGKASEILSTLLND